MRIVFEGGIPAFDGDSEFEWETAEQWGPFSRLCGVRAGGPVLTCLDAGRTGVLEWLELEAEDAGRAGLNPGRVTAEPGRVSLLAVVYGDESGDLLASVGSPIVVNEKACRGVQVVPAACEGCGVLVLRKGGR